MPAVPHAFRDQSLFELALTHSSAGRARDNERLEFLGDAVLDLVVAEELYRASGIALAEGEMTERKAAIVSRRTLADAASRLGLDELVQVGPGLRERALPRSVLANVYEGVLGAVYLDAGLEAARAFVRATLGSALADAGGPARGRNPKQDLQQLCQRELGGLPAYVLLDERGAAHARAFRVAVEVGGRRFPGAWGRTRKEAETWAAREALLVLEASAPAGSEPA
ncbi:MAG: ribonuclease III [Planctomycetes bacterium]|nr:ribonuclease III [Planctomycetota bacterium]